LTPSAVISPPKREIAVTSLAELALAVPPFEVAASVTIVIAPVRTIEPSAGWLNPSRNVWPRGGEATTGVETGCCPGTSTRTATARAAEVGAEGGGAAPPVAPSSSQPESATPIGMRARLGTRLQYAHRCGASTPSSVGVSGVQLVELAVLHAQRQQGCERSRDRHRCDQPDRAHERRDHLLGDGLAVDGIGEGDAADREDEEHRQRGARIREHQRVDRCCDVVVAD